LDPAKFPMDYRIYRAFLEQALLLYGDKILLELNVQVCGACEP